MKTARDADYVRRLGRAIDKPVAKDHEGWTHGQFMDAMAMAALDFIEADRASREPGRDQTLEEAAMAVDDALASALAADSALPWLRLVARRVRGMKSSSGPETWDEHMRADGACRLGVYCARHEFIHGGEAEHLRKELSRLGNERVDAILEKVDARDSCAYLEAKAKERASTPPDSPRLRPKESPGREPGKCATWCGTEQAGPIENNGHREYRNRGRAYCTEACRDAGRPSNPGDSDKERGSSTGAGK